MLHMDDASSNNDPVSVGQANDGLGCPNPSITDAIVTRGQQALQRLCRGFNDWLDIGEALQVGRVEVMAAVNTNQPSGRRYEKAMADWLLSRGFHRIDKGTRTRLLECLKHRVGIEKWRATLTETERFRFNHPDAVLRRWKASTVVPDPNAPPKTSAITKLKETNIELQEKLYRAEREIARSGGDLWAPEDRPEDIADIMLGKLTSSKAERVARAILAKLKVAKKAEPSKPVATDATASAEARKAHYGDEEVHALVAPASHDRRL